VKRNFLAVAVAVCLLLPLLSTGGCAHSATLGIDTFAALPAASAVADPDTADVVLYALIVKVVSPTFDAIKVAHDRKQISEAQFIELARYAQESGHYAKKAMEAVDAWRAGQSGAKEAFATAYTSALIAGAQVAKNGVKQ
jgi:hypothetical protein